MNDEAAIRVLIDGAIVKPHLGGIATYVAELSAALASRPGVEVCIATSAASSLDLPPSVEVIALPPAVRQFTRRTIWRERTLATLASAWHAQVVIAPTVELPLRRLRIPTIMVVHDLGAVQFPDLYGRLRWLRFATGIPFACRRADHVVCVSQATRTALRECHITFKAPCTVIWEAGRALPQRPRSVRAPPYILCVGSILPHKNVRTLVEAMDDDALRDAELLLAGPLDSRQRARFAQWRARTRTPSRITHLGYVAADALAELYAGAAAVALPSRYEGFGLTLLEAMTSGVPAVASSIPAHREVGRDSVLYVAQPLSPAEWSRALAAVLTDPALSESLSRKGRDRARAFAWDAVGAQMALVARRLVARPTGTGTHSDQERSWL
jgi:glycosyltransferase involved in cell wall biosynthesis